MKTYIGAFLLIASASVHASPINSAPRIHSRHAIVFDAVTKEILLQKDADTPAPFASITKLLTAVVALDTHPDFSETLLVANSDVDNLKHSSSHVPVGTALSREDMLHIALMASENRAASALSRYYPGGQASFIGAMNAKAKELGMIHTTVEEPTGLSPNNRASAHDLMNLVLAAGQLQPIVQFTTMAKYSLAVGRRVLGLHNTNALVGKPDWDIELSKTGYTTEAGRCIAMQLAVNDRHIGIVLLGEPSSATRMADIASIKRWVAGEQPLILEASFRRKRGRSARNGFQYVKLQRHGKLRKLAQM